MNYQQAVEFIQSFPDAERGLPGAKPSRSLKMPLSVMKTLLQAMGNPQNTTNTIHITGSKGKGSTATFIASILKQAGLHTALFTSPHIHSYRERIAFDLQPISEEIFAQGIAELKPFVEKLDQQEGVVSTFGILTALFFRLVGANSKLRREAQIVGRTTAQAPALHLKATEVLPVEWQIVEVGLGGKDDLTNVFDHKEAVVITPISLEHTAILGETRSAIAENKGGIITSGCLVVLAPQPDIEVVEVIRKICAQKEAELIEVDKLDKLPYPIQLLGEHQITNTITALALIDGLVKRKKIVVGEDAIKEGLAAAFLPGRFEIIEGNTSIVLDGAHNGDSAKALAKTLYQSFPDRPVILIIGINEDKDLDGIWQALKHNVAIVVATRSNNYRSLPSVEIRNRISAWDEDATVHYTDNIDEALQHAKELAATLPEAIICVCGSLYLVAEARERLLR